MYCDDLERAVSHTPTDSSSEMSCTIINLILLLLIKTDMVSFCKTVWCRCKIEILLTGKFIRINMCKEGQPGSKFSWCLEGRGLLWALGDVVLLFGGGWLVVIGGYFSVWTCTCWSGVILFVFAGAIFLPKNKVFYVTRSINWGSFLILCWLILSKFLWIAEFLKL